MLITDTRHPVKIWTEDIEAEAIQQTRNLANMPFIHSHVAVMPDAHAGKGSTVGTVIATKGAIIPAAVGVDIGCGMRALQLPFKVDRFGDSLYKLRHQIERSVPVGFHQHRELNPHTETISTILQLDQLSSCSKKAPLQLGTLGGGNHFIELCADQNNQAWIVLHSGSRNLGKTLAEQHITKAQNLMKSYFIDLPDPDLAYFVQNTNEFKDYLADLNLAQQYAYWNRTEMMRLVLKDVLHHVNMEFSDLQSPILIDCHHNYTQMENHFGKNIWVTRKGAVSAREGQYGIIPGSMGTKSYIVKGKGNLDSFCSCSHGAGRKMSRTKARKTFSLDDIKSQTQGVECRKDIDVIDEIPGAYKDIDQVMENQKDLVEVVFTLKQIMCIKG